MKRRNLQGGFTLIEILIVVSVLLLIFTVVMFNVKTAREKLRDSSRLNDLQQIELALRLYRDMNATAVVDVDAWFPAVPDGELIGDQVGTFDNEMADFLSGVIQDPKHGEDGFGYYYSSSYNCSGHSSGDRVVLIALGMERDENKNFNQLCLNNITLTGPNPNVTPDSDSYILIIEQTGWY